MTDKVSLKTYALAKSAINKAADGLGVVRGKNATIKSVDTVDGGQNVVFEWTGDSGATQTTTVFLPNGVSVSSAEIDTDNHLVLKLSDGSEIDAGELPSISEEDREKLDSLPGIKSIGTGLSLDDDTGELVATGDAVASSVDWSNVENKPDATDMATVIGWFD